MFINLHIFIHFSSIALAPRVLVDSQVSSQNPKFPNTATRHRHHHHHDHHATGFKISQRDGGVGGEFATLVLRCASRRPNTNKPSGLRMSHARTCSLYQKGLFVETTRLHKSTSQN